jgi:hypothetical protein
MKLSYVPRLKQAIMGGLRRSTQPVAIKGTINPSFHQTKIVLSQLQVLSLQSLKQGLPAVTSAFGMAIAEAGAICLTDEAHQPGVVINVEGEFSTTFKLEWQPVTEQIRRCWNDEEYTTEQAAYGIAFLLILQLTNHWI